MRAHPAVTESEAGEWLRSQARAIGLDAERPELAEILRRFARAMAAVSAVALTDDPADLT